MNEYQENEKRGLYRARDGVIAGVCKGLARHLDLSVGWVRVGVIFLAIFTAFWPVVIAYIIMAFVMKPEPVIPFKTQSDKEFYNSYTSSRTMALHRLKNTFEALDRRIRRMEDVVTNKEYDWENRLNDKQ